MTLKQCARQVGLLAFTKAEHLRHF